ncbi:MAG: iron ABC transporter permease [Rikenellaceae bacterium]
MSQSTKLYSVIYTTLITGLCILFFLNLTYGAVDIPLRTVWQILMGAEGVEVKRAWVHIVRESRLPQAITALLTGGALAVSGLMLQTLFRNPLAGPSILGISNGANLGVAIVMLSMGGYAIEFGGYMAVILAAVVGAGAVMAVIIWFSARVNSNTMLLIVGIMVGYIVSSFISVLNFQASSDKVHAFVMWGMGDFAGVSMAKLPYFVGLTIVGLMGSLLLIKPLNALLLGEKYAANLGVKIKTTRILILLCTGVLTAAATAFCGPISFIGLAVPHIARLALRTSNHQLLLPVTILLGGGMALLCNLLTVMPFSNQVFPLNAVTPLLGAPVIIYVIINRKNIQYFN